MVVLVLLGVLVVMFGVAYVASERRVTRRRSGDAWYAGYLGSDSGGTTGGDSGGGGGGDGGGGGC